MPNRIIKESIRTSKKVNALTDFEYRLWSYLITYVDDYGRGQADPAILKGFVFPLRKTVTEKGIMDALYRIHDLGMLTLYEVDGEQYLCFPNWGDHQRIQTKKSKFPAPQDSTVIHRGSPPESNPIQSNPNQSESNPNPNSSRRMKKPTLDEVRAYIEEKGYNVDPERFMDYHDSNGWRVGKNPMKDWKATVRTWAKNNYGKQSSRVRIETPDWYKKQQTQGFTEQAASEDLQKQFEEMKLGFEQKGDNT